MVSEVRILIEPHIVHPSASPTDNVAVRVEGYIEAVVVVREFETLEFPVVCHGGEYAEHRRPADLGMRFLKFLQNHSRRCVAVQTFQSIDHEFFLDCVSPFHSFGLLGCHILSPSSLVCLPCRDCISLSCLYYTTES